MFSSLSSFLPSALNHLNQPQSPENAPDIDVEDEEDEDQGHNGQLTESPTKAEHGRKKEKKEKGPHEMFIFVRPPPAKSNHPLNLQVQLVPPNSRQRRLSTESGVDTDRESVVAGAQLSRTPSVASEASSYSTSGYASTSSFQSYSSTASGTSGRRMIIPLYNLQAHNVMTNTIVDAGTDAKIAKFHKRGLEMIDLAVMEPVEVWLSPPGTHIPAAGAPGAAGPGGSGSGGGGAGGGTSSVRGSLDDPRLRQRLSGVFLRTGQSPGSSAVSLASGNDNHPHSHQHHEAIPASSAVVPPAASLAAGKKNNNIFGKLFDRKKKDTPVPATPAPTSAPNINLISPKTPTFNSPKTPTQVQTPASPRHAKNLSASFTGAFRKTQTQIQTPPVSPVPSPSQSHFQTTTQDTPNANNSTLNRLTGLLRPTSSAGGRPSTASGVSPTRNEEREREQERERSRSRSRSRGRDDVQVEDAVEITPTISPPPDGSSRFSTLSTTSSVGVGVGIGGQHLSVPSQQPQPQIQIPVIPIPPTLGIHPTLSTPGGPNVLASGAFNSFASKGYPPPKNLGYGKGPAMYVWVVRKWIKGPSGEKGGFLGGLGIRGIEGLPRNDSSEDVFDLAQIEVRVEWKRGGGKKAKKRKMKKARGEGEGDGSRRSSTGNGELGVPPHHGQGPNESNTSLALTTTSVATGTTSGGEESQSLKNKKKKNRLSGLSVSSVGGGSNEGGLFRKGSRKSVGTGTETDDGDDSDPEDSETPWSCTVKVRRLGAPRGTGSRPGSVIVGDNGGSGGSGGPIKIKVGTLSPTPHHPKVVAMLKVPFPLPDLEVERMNIKKREGKERTSMIPPTAISPGAGLVLTAEEIKDVICSTGLWLVVREGFGGVGKVSRKGDGWRIRA